MDRISHLLKEYRHSYQMIHDELSYSGLLSRGDVDRYYHGDMSRGGQYAKAVALDMLGFVSQYESLSMRPTAEQSDEFSHVAVGEFTAWWLYRNLPNIGYYNYRSQSINS